MTRKEHLKKLPLQKRLQAMEQIRKQCNNFSYLKFRINIECERYDTLMASIDMSVSKQGFDYWYSIHNKYFNS